MHLGGQNSVATGPLPTESTSDNRIDTIRNALDYIFVRDSVQNVEAVPLSLLLLMTYIFFYVAQVLYFPITTSKVRIRKERCHMPAPEDLFRRLLLFLFFCGTGGSPDGSRSHRVRNGSRELIDSQATSTLLSPLALVVGTGHSGTTLFCSLLDRQVDLCCFQETYFLTAKLHAKEKASRFGRTCAERGKHSWVEKTPIHIRHLAEAIDLFPDTKILYLTRHPLDVIFSLRERYLLDNSAAFTKAVVDGDRVVALEQAVERWKKDTLAILPFLGPRTLVIKYEDIVETTSEVLMKILAWLGIVTSNGVIVQGSANFGGDRRHESRRAAQLKGKISKDGIGQFQERATLEEVCFVATQIDTLARLNYSFPDIELCHGRVAKFVQRSAFVKPWRLPSNPLIFSRREGNWKDNINGPSVIKSPLFLQTKQGCKYLMYFASHSGLHIRLATSDAIEGPWKIQNHSCLQLPKLRKANHIASPDVHVDHEKQIIKMYCHVAYEEGQKTFLATSGDGWNFSFHSLEPLGPFYMRVFQKDGEYFAFERYGKLMRSKTDTIPFQMTSFRLPDQVRHVSVEKYASILRVYFSEVGDAPERIKMRCIFWNSSSPEQSLYSSKVTLLVPQEIYEGSEIRVAPSQEGAATGLVNQLRDPFFFSDSGRRFLFYACGGESGIAVVELYALAVCPPGIIGA